MEKELKSNVFQCLRLCSSRHRSFDKSSGVSYLLARWSQEVPMEERMETGRGQQPAKSVFIKSVTAECNWGSVLLGSPGSQCGPRTTPGLSTPWSFGKSYFQGLFILWDFEPALWVAKWTLAPRESPQVKECRGWQLEVRLRCSEKVKMTEYGQEQVVMM